MAEYRDLEDFATNARCLLDDWARELGITIEWVHNWEKGDKWHTTAFGYLPGSRKPQTMTVTMTTVGGMED